MVEKNAKHALMIISARCAIGNKTQFEFHLHVYKMESIAVILRPRDLISQSLSMLKGALLDVPLTGIQAPRCEVCNSKAVDAVYRCHNFEITLCRRCGGEFRIAVPITADDVHNCIKNASLLAKERTTAKSMFMCMILSNQLKHTSVRGSWYDIRCYTCNNKANHRYDLRCFYNPDVCRYPIYVCDECVRYAYDKMHKCNLMLFLAGDALPTMLLGDVMPAIRVLLMHVLVSYHI